MTNMKVEHSTVGPVETNCYLVTNTKTNELIVIDPGEEADMLISKIKASGAKPAAILLTHAHFDHITGAAAVAGEFGVKIYLHEKDRDTLTDTQMNASWMIGHPMTYTADIFVKDEQELEIAGFKIRVLFTPGHTPGGCCYYFPYEDVVFTGDSLFCGSIGRTDFKGGSMSDLVRSVKEKLMSLPDKTAVYPGHNESSTIENERMFNPYL